MRRLEDAVRRHPDDRPAPRPPHHEAREAQLDRARLLVVLQEEVGFGRDWLRRVRLRPQAGVGPGACGGGRRERVVGGLGRPGRAGAVDLRVEDEGRPDAEPFREGSAVVSRRAERAARDRGRARVQHFAIRGDPARRPREARAHRPRRTRRERGRERRVELRADRRRVPARAHLLEDNLRRPSAVQGVGLCGATANGRRGGIRRRRRSIYVPPGPCASRGRAAGGPHRAGSLSGLSRYRAARPRATGWGTWTACSPGSSAVSEATQSRT